ncbi:unnamed protein product, partial [Larinioides sclopetarius]
CEIKWNRLLPEQLKNHCSCIIISGFANDMLQLKLNLFIM